MSIQLVANGCSFTQEHHLPKEHRWTTLCGIDVNLGFGGGSNDRIFYTTIEYLNQHRPKTLIIGWTLLDRFMMPKSNGSRAIITPWHSFDENLGGDDTNLAEFYFRNCHNEFSSLERMLNYMLFIQDLCKFLKIKLLYFNAYPNPIDEKRLGIIAKKSFVRDDLKLKGVASVDLSKKHLQKMIDRLDRDIWIQEFWYSMHEHCEHLPKEKDGHPNIDGSAYWADLVKQYL